jgi:hypothetical protein
MFNALPYQAFPPGTIVRRAAFYLGLARLLPGVETSFAFSMAASP